MCLNVKQPKRAVCALKYRGLLGPLIKEPYMHSHTNQKSPICTHISTKRALYALTYEQKETYVYSNIEGFLIPWLKSPVCTHIPTKRALYALTYQQKEPYMHSNIEGFWIPWLKGRHRNRDSPQRSSSSWYLFYRALLQKRPIILRSLLIVATP